MKKTLYFLIGILVWGCVNKPNSSKNSDIVINSELKSIEIEYSESREKMVENLKKIWKCENLFIAKSEINFNGEVSNNISIMVTDLQQINSEENEIKIKLTADLIKKGVLNYKKFSELEIICNYSVLDEERRTWAKKIKTAEL
jgi:hypothetical protein